MEREWGGGRRGLFTYARRFRIRRSDEYGFARDAVHEDAGAALQVIEVDKTVLCDKVDDAVLLRNLHCNGEVVDCFLREVDVNRLLSKHWVGGLVINFDNVEFCASRGANRKSKDLCIRRSTL